MLTWYTLLVVLGWLILVMSFLTSHCPEKTTSEMIREVR